MITPIYGDFTPDIFRDDSLVVAGFTRPELLSLDGGRHRADTLIDAWRISRSCGQTALAYAYDDDPREIYEIREVIAHVRYLADRCPHFLYHLMPDMPVMRAPLLCLYGARVTGTRDGMAQVAIPDIAVARATAHKLSDAAIAYAISIKDRIGGLAASGVIQSLGVW